MPRVSIWSWLRLRSPRLKDVWTRLVLPAGQGYISDEVYHRALGAERKEIKRRYAEAFLSTGAEALLLPTTPSTAPMIGQEDRITGWPRDEPTRPRK